MPSPERVRYPNAPVGDVVELGRQFEDLVVGLFDELLETKIRVYQTAKEQLEIGESPQGYEIKRDQPIHRETGRYVIEVAEKSGLHVRGWTPSGIYRKDNSLFYVVGGPERAIFVFSKHQLVLEHHRIGGDATTFNGTKRQFFMSTEECRRLALYWFEPGPWRVALPECPSCPPKVLREFVTRENSATAGEPLPF